VRVMLRAWWESREGRVTCLKPHVSAARAASFLHSPSLAASGGALTGTSRLHRCTAPRRASRCASGRHARLVARQKTSVAARHFSRRHTCCQRRQRPRAPRTRTGARTDCACLRLHPPAVCHQQASRTSAALRASLRRRQRRSAAAWRWRRTTRSMMARASACARPSDA